MKRILLKSFIFYMLLAQGLGNVAYAKHVCVMTDSSASSSMSAAGSHHDSESMHEHADECVCAGDHQHCSASPSITINTDITVELAPIGNVVMAMDSHPFPAHLTDLIRPPSPLSC